MKILRVSHSQLQTYKDCRRLYHHGYNAKREVRAAYFPFVFGSAMHSALEVFYESRGKNCLKKMISAANQHFDEVDQSPLQPQQILDLLSDKSKVAGICEAYPEVYSDDFLEFEEFLVEHHFELKFGVHAGYDMSYQGFIDGLFKDAAGDWWVFETKTKAYNKPESQEMQNYVRKVHIDHQVLSYMWGGAQILRRLYADKNNPGPLQDWFPKGVIYNVIQKPAIKKKKTETQSEFRKRVKEEYTVNAEAKEYFVRYPLQLKQEHVDKWWEETRRWLMEIAGKKSQRKKSLFPMNSGHCTSKYGACRWMDACATGQYKAILYKKKDPDYVHPRLKKLREQGKAVY